MGRRRSDARERPLTPAQQRRVQNHLHVVAWVLSGMRRELAQRERAGRDPDEPPAWGHMGLVQAGQTWEEATPPAPPPSSPEGAAASAEFESYAWWRVRGNVRDELRREQRIARYEELGSGEDAANEYAAAQGPDDPWNDSPEGIQAQVRGAMSGCAAAYFSGVAAAVGRMDPERALAYAQAWSRFEQCVALLPARDADLVRRRMIQGQPMKEVLAETGIKKSTADRRLAAAMNRVAALMQSPAPVPRGPGHGSPESA